MSDRMHLQRAQAHAARVIAGIHTIHDLNILVDACQAAEYALLGVSNQPRSRYSGGALKEMHRAGAELAERRIAAIKKMRRMTPRNETEALLRAEVLTRHFFETGADDLTELQSIADSLIPYQQAKEAA